MTTWRETTNERDPLTKHGEWTWDIPLLEHSVGSAGYTVTFDPSEEKWHGTFWHGNRGHYVDGYAVIHKTKESAQASCHRHFLRLLAALTAVVIPELPVTECSPCAAGMNSFTDPDTGKKMHARNGVVDICPAQGKPGEPRG